jgi:hypothetical protein
MARADLVEGPSGLALVLGFKNGAAHHQDVRARLTGSIGAPYIDATRDSNLGF